MWQCWAISWELRTPVTSQGPVGSAAHAAALGLTHQAYLCLPMAGGVLTLPLAPAGDGLIPFNDTHEIPLLRGLKPFWAQTS